MAEEPLDYDKAFKTIIAGVAALNRRPAPATSVSPDELYQAEARIIQAMQKPAPVEPKNWKRSAMISASIAAVFVAGVVVAGMMATTETGCEFRGGQISSHEGRSVCQSWID